MKINVEDVLVSEGLSLKELRREGMAYWKENRELLRALIDAKAITMSGLKKATWKSDKNIKEVI